MKLFKVLLFLCLAFTLSNCATDDDQDPEPIIVTNIDGQLTASISSTSFTAAESNTSGLFQNGVIGLNAQNSDGDTIAFTITTFDNEGSYDLSGFTTEATAIYLSSGDNKFYNSANEGGSGTLTISNINPDTSAITGSFNFIAVKTNSDSPNETIEVSNGVFTNVIVSGL